MERFIEFTELLIKQVFQKLMGREMRPVHPWTAFGAPAVFFTIPLGLFARVAGNLNDVAIIAVAAGYVFAGSFPMQRLADKFSRGYKEGEENDNIFFYLWLAVSGLVMILIAIVGRGRIGLFSC